MERETSNKQINYVLFEFILMIAIREDRISSFSWPFSPRYIYQNIQCFKNGILTLSFFLFENVDSYGNILGIKIVEDISAVIPYAFAYYVVASRSRGFALRNEFYVPENLSANHTGSAFTMHN